MKTIQIFSLSGLALGLLLNTGCTDHNYSRPAVDTSETSRQAENSDKLQPGYLGMSLPADFRFFNEVSPWNTPIPANPEISPHSKEMINTLEKRLRSIGRGLHPQIAYRQWTTPILVVDSDQVSAVDVPTWRKDRHLYESIDPDHNGIAEDIPIPHEAWQDPQKDGHMAIVDPKKRRVWEFSIARKNSNHHWSASVIDTWDLDGPGYRTPFKPHTAWWRSGAVGAGVSVIAGLIRVEEIKAGVISHALAMTTPSNRRSANNAKARELCSPVASRTDGRNIGYNFIPEGARVQLDPNLDLNQLGLSKDTKVIARALQTYGAFVVDNAGGLGLRAQNLGADGGQWNEHRQMFRDMAKLHVKYFRVLDCEIVRKE